MGHQVLRLVRLPYGALSIGAQIGQLVLWGAKYQGSDWPAHHMGRQVSGLRLVCPNYWALSVGAQIGPLVLCGAECYGLRLALSPCAKCQGSYCPNHPMGCQVSGLRLARLSYGVLSVGAQLLVVSAYYVSYRESPVSFVKCLQWSSHCVIGSAK